MNTIKEIAELKTSKDVITVLVGGILGTIYTGIALIAIGGKIGFAFDISTAPGGIWLWIPLLTLGVAVIALVGATIGVVVAVMFTEAGRRILAVSNRPDDNG